MFSEQYNGDCRIDCAGAILSITGMAWVGRKKH